MATEKRLIDANELRERFDDIPSFIGLTGGCVQQYIDQAPTVDAVEVVRIEEVKQEILQIMDNFISEYSRIGFYGKSDAMEIAKRLVNAALTDLCPNCGAKMDGDGNG